MILWNTKLYIKSLLNHQLRWSGCNVLVFNCEMGNGVFFRKRKSIFNNSSVDNKQSCNILSMVNKTSRLIKVPLTSKEISILQQTWPKVKENWLQILLVTFEKWFSIYPQLRYMFRSLQTDISFEDLLRTESLKLHVDKIREVVEMLLCKIHDADCFVNTLLDFGRQHHMLGAEQQYATGLQVSLLFGITMIMDVDVQTENAWDSLFRFVMDLLKLGMRMQKEEEEEEEERTKYIKNEVLIDTKNKSNENDNSSKNNNSGETLCTHTQYEESNNLEMDTNSTINNTRTLLVAEME